MNFGFLRKFLPGAKRAAAAAAPDPVPTPVASDGFRVAAGDDPLAAEHACLSALLEQNDGWRTQAWPQEPKLEDSEVGRQILALDHAAQAQFVHALGVRLALLERRLDSFRTKHLLGYPPSEAAFNTLRGPRAVFAGATRTLLQGQPPLDAGALGTLLAWCLSPGEIYDYTHPLDGIVSAVEAWAQRDEPDEALNEAAGRLQEKFQALPGQDFQRYASRIAQALAGAVHPVPIAPIAPVVPIAPIAPIVPGDVWADAALADLGAMPTEWQAWWCELFAYAQSASGSKPTARWMTEGARRLTEAAARDDFKRHVLRWFPLVDEPRPAPEEAPADEPGAPLAALPHPLAIHDQNADLLRGLVWLCARLEDDREIPRAVAALAISAYRKVPGLGPRLVRVGNACIHTLGTLPGPDALAQLAQLKVEVKHGAAQKEIAKALNAATAAARKGLPAEEVEEMMAPSYGLTEVGRLVRKFGNSGFAAELAVKDAHATELLWRNLKTGRTQRTVPAAVKTGHAEELRELKAAEKDLLKILTAQAERMDGLFLQRKCWPLGAWRERYLDHPLLGTLTRRLIWKFHRSAATEATRAAEDGAFFVVGLWLDGAVRDRRGQPLALDETAAATTGKSRPEEITVSLWHPLDAGGETAEVTAWRGWLEEHEVRQPFKQAHREVYLLTPAEECAGTYSNRFAAHLLKQQQFHALCAQRGWKNKLRLMGDDTYPPAARELAAWGLRAEYWVEGASGESGRDTTESGAYLYLSTDQVRFHAVSAPQLMTHAEGAGGRHPGAASDAPLGLADVPPLVFSEIMRDVDLFVGIASVGNDPVWNDGGPQGHYRDYWAEYSFGELGATAQTRRAALGRLVPRLKIAARCTFSDRFLVVRGELHTYKIHLGSGNILMSPDDRYLCIVPGPATRATDAPAAGGAPSKMFLPFEGDRTLSVILSKAFLLAADDRIADPTITRQIRA